MTSNIWSSNKYVNTLVNILLFLLSINFLHYGQFILPIICLILFIDNKCKFIVNKWSTFIILCLFSISFFIFSYSYDHFYSLMGFCLPMAYYIGSNIKKADEESVKTIIYIIAFGMALHVVLNFAYDFYYDGLALFSQHLHRDIWLGNVSSKKTATAVLYVFLIGCIYYLFIYEKNKTLKIVGIALLIIIMIYDIGLGRRTPILLLIISFVSSFVLTILYRKKINIKKVLISIIVAVTLCVIIYILVLLNIFNLKEILSNTLLVKKFLWVGLDAERLDIFIKAFKSMPNYLWGGRKIYESVGIEVHDVWMDIYDWSGIIPYILFILYSIKCLITVITYHKNKNINNEMKVLVATITICIIAQLFLEPIMSGSSLFLICVVLFISLIEKESSL